MPCRYFVIFLLYSFSIFHNSTDVEDGLVFDDNIDNLTWIFAARATWMEETRYPSGRTSTSRGFSARASSPIHLHEKETNLNETDVEDGRCLWI